MLAEKYRSEIDTILNRYPTDQKRSAVMPLLYLAQREYGYVTRDALCEVSELTGLTPAEVASVSGFYTLYHTRHMGKRRVQVCADLPCALRGAEKFAEELCAGLGVKLGETTADGEFTVETVTCLAGCDKAPLFQVQDAEGVRYYESEAPDRPLSVEKALEILSGLRHKT